MSRMPKNFSTFNLGLLLLLSSAPLWAASQTTQITLTQSCPTLLTGRKAREVDLSKQRLFFQKVTQKINAQLGPEIRIPSKFHIRLIQKGEGNQSAFYPDTGTIDLEWVDGEDERVSLFLHEYGHAIFYENAREHVNFHSSELRFNRENLFRGDFSNSLPSVAESYRRLENLYIVNGYQELFADIFAVLYSNDPSAMQTAALSTLSENLTAPSHRYRERAFKGAGLTQKQMDSRTKSSPEALSYVSFAQMRRTLWKKYLAPSKRQKIEMSHLLSAILKAIKSEYVSYATNTHRGDFRVQITEMNRRFEDKIEEQLDQEERLSLGLFRNVKSEESTW